MSLKIPQVLVNVLGALLPFDRDGGTRAFDVLRKLPLQRHRYYCTECGGKRIQATGWFDLNTGIFLDEDGPLEDVWCTDCNDHTLVELCDS